ncbi:MAG: DUF4491 family protein [Bacillota bacterium]|nr:DUF4491 family protein [Bacillota bacterium]
MNIHGIIIGLASFLLIGIFHPIVIKTEYYLGARVWPIFLIAGLLLIFISFFISNIIFSCIIAIAGFCSLWSIGELKNQEKRVKKGWFPANPNKK